MNLAIMRSLDRAAVFAGRLALALAAGIVVDAIVAAGLYGVEAAKINAETIRSANSSLIFAAVALALALALFIVIRVSYAADRAYKNWLARRRDAKERELDRLGWNLSEARDELRKFSNPKRYLTNIAVLIGFGLGCWYDNANNTKALDGWFVGAMFAVFWVWQLMDEWRYARLYDRYVRQAHSHAIVERLDRLDQLIHQLASS
jgi:hypothetical protein